MLAEFNIVSDRSKMLKETRDFFYKKSLLETDCQQMTEKPSVDAYIDLMTTEYTNGKSGYLHTSPEYAMKKLISKGSGDIFFLGHVFRKFESGRANSSEFTMVEWYRKNISFEDLINETLDLISLFLNKKPVETFTYREIFLKFFNIDPFKASKKELLEILNDDKKTNDTNEKTFESTSSVKGLLSESDDRDTILQVILGEVEPLFGEDSFFVLKDFPPSQAALSKLEILPNGFTVAKRFEVYHKGLELANGFFELTDPKEQRARFEESNLKRIALGKEILDIDQEFLDSLGNIKDSLCGVSVGFDRLMMLRHNKKNISSILLNSFLQ